MCDDMMIGNPIESIEVKFLFDDLVSTHLVSVTKISKLKPLTLSDERSILE